MASLAWLYLLQPTMVIAVTSLLLLLLFWRHRLTGSVLGTAFVAYFLAILGKVVFQLAIPVPPGNLAAGLYYGSQTMVLEVGLAYAIARYSIERGRLGIEQAASYGASLAFWENGFLLGVLSLPGLIGTLATGGSGLPSGSMEQVLGLIALGTLERVSSILIHLAWGILTVAAAASRKDRLLAVALPMGMLDFLVPFAPSLGLVAFEGLVFALSALALAIAYLMTREEWPRFWGGPNARSALTAYQYHPTTTGGDVPRSPPESVDVGARAQCPRCGAVFAAARNPFLPHIGHKVLRNCPNCGAWDFMGPAVETRPPGPPPR